MLKRPTLPLPKFSLRLLVGAGGPLGARHNGDMGDMADTGKCFATKPKSVDTAQIVEVLQLARCKSFAHNAHVVALEERIDA